MIRLAMGESTQRSELDDRHLTARLREVAVEQLEQVPEEEVWLIADSSDLRKPYAEMMPYLMQVPDLEEVLVPGYRTEEVCCIITSLVVRRPMMSREPAEVQEALETASQALTPLKDRKTITWLLDSGFDDIAVWHTIWEAQEHLVCRVYHLERLVSFQDRQGQWQEGKLEQARGQMPPLARVQTTLVAKRGKQPLAKKQPVEVEVAACPVRVTYSTSVRRQVIHEVWLGEVHILGTDQDPWLLLTDWPGTDEQSTARIFTMYRQRWGVEDSFKFLETCLGWEEVQVLDWQALRTLVALGWVAAGFLYGLGGSPELG